MLGWGIFDGIVVAVPDAFYPTCCGWVALMLEVDWRTGVGIWLDFQESVSDFLKDVTDSDLLVFTTILPSFSSSHLAIARSASTLPAA